MVEILDYIEEHPKETQRLIGLEYSQLKQLSYREALLIFGDVYYNNRTYP